jgi:membrane associated rhomboid family serine protease
LENGGQLRRVKRKNSGFQNFLAAVEVSLMLVGLLWAIRAADVFLGLQLNRFGIIPRSGPGLVGIVFSPLLHGSNAHLAANSVGIFFLLVLLFFDKRYSPGETISSIWLMSGLGTWLIGHRGVHIGASSIIYGLVSYLIASGFWMRSWRAAFVAMLVILGYGGIVYGMLPQAGPISWEGHLSGAIAGYLAARHQHR